MSVCLEKSDGVAAQSHIFARKRPHTQEVREPVATVLSDYRIKLSDAADKTCNCCFTPIVKGKVGIMKIVDGSDVWCHAKCFAEYHLTFGWNETADKFPGFNMLKKKNKTAMQELFK